LTKDKHVSKLSTVRTEAQPQVPKEADGLCEAFRTDPDRVARARTSDIPEPEVHDVAELFRALANPTRLKIIQVLAGGEMCVCEIAEVLGLSMSATSHQLAILRNLRMVAFRMDGKFAQYSLRDPFVHALLVDGRKHLAHAGGGR
jgi:DNA-binding transcriptional ArsR family regulator